MAVFGRCRRERLADINDRLEKNVQALEEQNEKLLEVAETLHREVEELTSSHDG